jgi:hypothetical protein
MFSGQYDDFRAARDHLILVFSLMNGGDGAVVECATADRS